LHRSFLSRLRVVLVAAKAASVALLAAARVALAVREGLPAVVALAAPVVDRDDQGVWAA
jgi:hypothetical protein